MQEMFPPRSSTTFVATFSWFWNVALCANALLRWVDKSHSVLGKKQCQVFGTTWLVLLLEKCATDLMKMFHRLCGNLSPTLGKWTTDFGKISHRLWENPSPTLGKICYRFGGNLPPALGNPPSDFGKIRHRFWGNLSPTLRKSVTDFGKIRHRLWGNPSPKFGEICHRFGGNLPQTLGKICHRLWGKTGLVLGKDWLGFRERLARFGGICSVFGLACDKAQVSLFWTLSMFGFRVLMFWVSPKICQVGRVKCSNL